MYDTQSDAIYLVQMINRSWMHSTSWQGPVLFEPIPYTYNKKIIDEAHGLYIKGQSY